MMVARLSRILALLVGHFYPFIQEVLLAQKVFLDKKEPGGGGGAKKIVTIV